MNNYETTANDQFVTDYLLVVENDASAYAHIQERKAEANGDPYLLGFWLWEEFEEGVMEATEAMPEVQQLLFRQMLIGYQEAFNRIGAHFMYSN
jgi:hypothetical protein